MNKFSTIAAALIGLILALYAIVEITSDPGQGIVKAVRAIALIFIPLAFAKPKIGLYGVFVTLANIEWIKRYAIYYGDASVWSVAATLVVPLAIFSAVILGVLMGSLVGATKMTYVRFFWFSIAAMVIIMILGLKGFSPFGIQMASNSGLYIAIIPVCLMLFPTQKEMMKLLDFCAVIFLPWALVAIYQFFFGFSEVDWGYASTGISPVFSKAMLSPEGSRPFGLAGSGPSFGAVSFMAWYVLWKSFSVKEGRLLSILIAIVYLIALILGSYRTALLTPFIALVGYPLFKNGKGLLVAYGAGMGAVVMMIVFSDFLLSNLTEYDSAVSSGADSEWAQDTIKLSTWSDRLRGYARLKDPEAWSFFGKTIEGGATDSAGKVDYGSRDYSHDMINSGLKNIGAVGLLFITIILLVFLTKIHGLVLKLPPGAAKNFAAMGLSYSILKLVLSVIGGGNLNVPPTATFTWLFFGAVAIACRDVIAEERVRKDEARRAAENAKLDVVETLQLKGA